MEIMGKNKNGVGFGRVDITVEKELRKEFDVEKSPELKLFFEGNRTEPISCEGNGVCVSVKVMLAMETLKHQHFSGLTELQTQSLLSPVGGQRVTVGASAPCLSKAQAPSSLWLCLPLGPLSHRRFLCTLP